MPEDLQQLADLVNLGPHQAAVEVDDEKGTTLRFVVHRPTIREQLRIGVQSASLLETPATVKGEGQVQAGMKPSVEPIYENLAVAVATLNTVVDYRPAGINKDVSEWTDMVLLWNLYTAFGEHLDSFRGPVSPESGGDSGPTPAA